MDSVDLSSLIEQLDDNIDDLEDALAPLAQGVLSHTAGNLPLLDKAQLYVLITYAIESIIFSFLRLNGIHAKEHPVFRELTRVKLYFDKINNVQSGDSKRGTTLNTPAAGRFIKHALAGNDKHDLKRAQQQSGEKARANIKFEHLSNKRKRGNDQASIPNPNSQLIGALSPQSSSSPVISNSVVMPSAGPATLAPEMSVDGSPAIVVLEKGHSRTQIELPSTRESRNSKQKKRAKRTLSRFNAKNSGPEDKESLFPNMSLQTVECMPENVFNTWSQTLEQTPPGNEKNVAQNTTKLEIIKQ